ncbi:MAG: hypothetical protein FWE27_05630 [Defluviitaleaceae bacterium]|nr:hypothetical protein [Defluviitaleaceae bacterium]
MKIFFGKENENFRINKTQANRQNNSRTGRRRDLMQERMAAQEREMRMRETEDKRISNLNEEIFRVQQSDMTDEIKNLTVSMLNDQINAIFMQRTEREQIAIEREMQRQQQELEERMRERERAAKENQPANKSEEELEQAAERSKIRNLTLAGTRMDNIASLQRTRASLDAEATRLRGEGNFDKHRTRQANHEILSFVNSFNFKTNGKPMEVGFLFGGNPLSTDSFKGRHLQNLNSGISRLTANINHQVGALYRDSQKMQEEQLRIYREQSRIPSQDEDKEENQSFDMRL